MLENKSVVYKYSVKLMWPAMCRNRSVEILKERPDLVDQMNKFRQKVENLNLNLNLNLAHLQSSRGTENDVGIKLAKGSLIVNVVRMMIHANTKEQGERGRRYKRNIDTNYRLYRYRYTCPTS